MVATFKIVKKKEIKKTEKEIKKSIISCNHKRNHYI